MRTRTVDIPDQVSGLGVGVRERVVDGPRGDDRVARLLDELVQGLYCGVARVWCGCVVGLRFHEDGVRSCGISHHEACPPYLPVVEVAVEALALGRQGVLRLLVLLKNVRLDVSRLEHRDRHLRCVEKGRNDA